MREDDPHPVSDVVAAISYLATEQLHSFAEFCGNQDASGLTAARLKRALSMPTAEAAHLARDLAALMAHGVLTPRDLQVVAETLAAIQDRKPRQTDVVEVVCTAPERFGVPVRTTYSTATQMIQRASDQIVVVGYVFTEGASPLVELLAVAQRDRNVRVIIIGNRMREQMPVLMEMWSTGVPLPRVFSRERVADDPMAALHAKLLICDRSEALVTSANFSHHGLHANVEIGLRVRSPAIERLSDFVAAMIRAGEVEPVTAAQ